MLICCRRKISEVQDDDLSQDSLQRITSPQKFLSPSDENLKFDETDQVQEMPITFPLQPSMYKNPSKNAISFSSGFWVRSGIEIWVRKGLTSRLNISYIYLIFALISR